MKVWCVRNVHIHIVIVGLRSRCNRFVGEKARLCNKNSGVFL